MDKNTLLGMVLMGAVLLGFMWLNQPAEEQIRQQREQAERLAEQERQKAPDNQVAGDSLTVADLNLIQSTIRQIGTPDTVNGETELKIAGIDLLMKADGSFTGTVDSPDGLYSIEQLTSPTANAISPAAAASVVKTIRDGLATAARYRGFARFLNGSEQTVTLSNNVLTLDISNKGAMISRAALKDYQTYDSTAVMLMSPETDSYSFTLMTANQRFDTREFYFTPTEVTDTSVTMSLDLGDGAQWAIRYRLPADGYVARMEVVQQGMQAIIPPSVATMDFTWNQRMNRNEAGRMFEERNSAIYYMFANGDVEHLSEGSNDDKSVTERLKWIGYKNQFFSAVVIPDQYFTAAELNSEVLKDNPTHLKELETRATLEYSASLENPAGFTLFLGPNSYPLLSDLQDEIAPDQNLHLTNLIPLGWALFRWINTIIIIPVFSFLGQFISNYGIIILLLTIFIKIILFPFTYKSYMSQARMRVLAPEIKEINERWPGNENAMKRQQESMALYSRAGASPFSGCLPMLLQMPILIAMFNFFPSAIELRGEHFLWVKDLSAPDAIVSWTTNIPFISSTFGNHISLFCLLMTAVNIIYTRINMQSQPGGNSMPGMKMMMYLMPLMFLVFFNNYAAGLSYYYFISLLITIAQTYIFRQVVSEESVRAKMRENAKKPRKKSKWMERLEEAQRQQQAALRERQRQQEKAGKRHR